MNKAIMKEGFIIELPKELVKQKSLQEGDWLLVRWMGGKEMVLEKPKKDYWEETFAWGKKFSKENKIKPNAVIKAIKDLRRTAK